MVVAEIKPDKRLTDATWDCATVSEPPLTASDLIDDVIASVLSNKGVSTEAIELEAEGPNWVVHSVLLAVAPELAPTIATLLLMSVP
jgi:hypothetical protein